MKKYIVIEHHPDTYIIDVTPRGPVKSLFFLLTVEKFLQLSSWVLLLVGRFW